MKTKICFFINTLNNSGGTERVTSVLANELLARNYDVSIIAWYGGTKSFYAIEEKVEIHAIFENDKGNIYKDYPKSLKRYKFLLDRISPDFLIDVCVALSLLSIPAIIGKKVKLIAWEHFNTNVRWNVYTATLSRFLAAKFANCVVTLTEGDKENYKLRYKAKSVVCIPNPITLQPSGYADLSSKTVLVISRFTYQKGIDLLLNIWKNVVSRKNDWKLNIIGDGELKAEMQELSQKLGLTDSVSFIRPTNNVEPYYLSSSIYAMTSRFEGLPLVLIEAKAFGLPIVSYNCETGPRDIINDRKDGILVPYLDAGEFENQLVGLMDDRTIRQRYAESGLIDVQRFALENIVSQWEQLLV